ncbi:gas vesicle protein GvpH [Halogeometricum pallidum]|nr:gas vesicle protein GvpH [Halogeometricum pallidum]
MTRSHRDDDDDDQHGPDDERPRTHIDINFSVTDLLSDLLSEAKRDSNRHSLSERPSGRPSRVGPGAQRRSDGTADREQTDAPADYHVDHHREGDELTIVADLAGAEHEDVTAGISPDRGEFVVAVDERVAERVPLPWDPVEVVETTFNNGVLQVRLRPVDGEA